MLVANNVIMEIQNIYQFRNCDLTFYCTFITM